MVVPLCRLAFCHVPSRQSGEVTCQQWLSMSGHPLLSVNHPLVCSSSSPEVLRLEQDLNLLKAPDDRLLGLVALGLVTLGGTRTCSAYRVTGNINGVVGAAILLPLTADSRAIS